MVQLIQIERKGVIYAITLSFNKLEARTIPLGEIDSIRGIFLESTQGKWIQTLSQQKIVRGAKLRESRLIMNLFGLNIS